MTNGKDIENPPIEDFYKNDINPDGLPLPFAGCVVSRDGEREDQQLRRDDPAILMLEGNWQVIETSPNGFPAVLSEQKSEAVVAATLETISDSDYTGALLGYDPDIGTFGLGTTTRPRINNLFQNKIDCFADCCEFENLKPVLESGLEGTPVGIVREKNKTDSEQRYDHRSLVSIYAHAEDHDPWTIIESLSLEGFAALIERYEVAASEIGKTFDTTPPWIHVSKSKPKSKGDPERTQELKEKFDDYFETSNTNNSSHDTS